MIVLTHEVIIGYRGRAKLFVNKKSSHNRDSKISFSEETKRGNIFEFTLNIAHHRLIFRAALGIPHAKETSLMLGSEYNWLISLTRTSQGVTQVRLSRSGLFTLSIALICFLGVALHAGSSPRVGFASDSGASLPKFVAVNTVKPAVESSPSGSIHPSKLHQ